MTHPVQVAAYGYPMAELVDGHWVVGPPDSVVTSTWGTFRIEVGALWDCEYVPSTHEYPTVTTAGTDITTINGVPTLIDSLSFGAPYRELTGQLTLPSLSPFDAAAWLVPGAFVDIYRVLTAEDAITYGVAELGYWHGFVASIESADGPGLSAGVSLQLLGALFGEIGMRAHQPTMLDDDRDVGLSLGQALNVKAYSRPLPPFLGFAYTSATTSITTRHRGSRGQTVLDFCDEMLGLAQNSTGQWTIDREYGATFPETVPRTYDLFAKPQDLASAVQQSTVFAGGYGVALSLTRDLTTGGLNAIYGEGLSPTVAGVGGDRWRNAKYPMLTATAPAYPDRNVGTTYPLVITDADSDFTDDVITQLSSQLRLAGWPAVQITDVFDYGLQAAIFSVKEETGWANTDPSIASDAEWDLMWQSGTGFTDLSSGFFRPLAEVPESQPYLFATDGDVIGQNDTGATKFDGRLRVEQTMSFSDNITKERARIYARRVVNQSAAGCPWSGTITLTSDPTDENGDPRSRLDISAGQWLHVNNLAGGTYLDFAVAAVSVAPETEGCPVTLTVSEKPWDLLDLSTRLDRDREARTDPAKSFYSLRSRPARPFRDAVGWDAESGAGIIAPTVLAAGWNVVKFVGAQRGSLAAISAQTYTPASKFALAFFGHAVTTGDLDGWVADPLAENTTHKGLSWWSEAAIQTDLDAHGFIEAWGEFGKACSYSPAAEDNDPVPSVTGKVSDAASMTFVSFDPPYLWAAIWIPTGTPKFKLTARVVIEE
jgi:hypothetical protein